MAAYYRLANGVFAHSNDIEEDIYHLIKDEVLAEMEKRGVQIDDTISAFKKIAREIEDEYGSN